MEERWPGLTFFFHFLFLFVFLFILFIYSFDFRAECKIATGEAMSKRRRGRQGECHVMGVNQSARLRNNPVI